MIYYSEKLCSKTFTGENVKKAFLSASKWIASNIIADKKFHEVTIEYLKDESLNQVTVVLYAGLKDKDVMEEHCAVCKEFHKSFFINEETSCNTCRIKGYKTREERHLAVKCEYYKELLRQKGAL